MQTLASPLSCASTARFQRCQSSAPITSFQGVVDHCGRGAFASNARELYHGWRRVGQR
jgi:hypothetical protein